MRAGSIGPDRFGADLFFGCVASHIFAERSMGRARFHLFDGLSLPDWRPLPRANVVRDASVISSATRLIEVSLHFGLALLKRSCGRRRLLLDHAGEGFFLSDHAAANTLFLGDGIVVFLSAFRPLEISHFRHVLLHHCHRFTISPISASCKLVLMIAAILACSCCLSLSLSLILSVVFFLSLSLSLIPSVSPPGEPTEKILPRDSRRVTFSPWCLM